MSLDVTAERQRVRMAALGLAVLVLLVGATLLALQFWFGGLAFVGVGLLLVGVALRMYAELHEEEAARIAQGKARASFADPYPTRPTSPTPHLRAEREDA